MITQTHNLNLIPGSVPPVVNVTQYDKTARTLVFNLWDGETSFSVPSGAAVTIRGTKPDGNGFEYAASMTGNTVKMDLQQQMATCAGSVRCEVRIASGTQILGTADFILEVKPSALNENTPLSETELPLIEKAAEGAAKIEANLSASNTAASNAAKSASQAASSASARRRQARQTRQDWLPALLPVQRQQTPARRKPPQARLTPRTQKRMQLRQLNLQPNR